MSDSRWRNWASRAVFECALIVLSIVLGLAANGWRESREQRRRMAEVRNYFNDEIRANRDQLASASYAPYHRKLAQAWTRLSDLPEPKAADRDATWVAANTGLHPFHPRDAVWTTFVHGEVLDQMAPQELLSLAEIYRAQDDLRQVNQQLYRIVLSPNAQADTPAYIRSEANAERMMLNDITFAESHLLEMYDQALRTR